MKTNVQYPPAQYLNECFTYGPESGKIFWKERPKHHFKDEHAWRTFLLKYAGKEAGTKGYRAN